MKRYISKIAVALLFAIAFTSCEQEKIMYDEATATPLFAFKETKGALPVYEEGVSTASLIVEISAKSNVDRVISLDVVEEGTTATIEQYTIDQASLVIPANEYTGEIKVTGNFSALTTEVLTLKLKLTGIDGDAHIEEGRSVYDLKIFKVCPFDSNDIVNTEFTAKSYQGTVSPANLIQTFTPVITKISDREYYFESLWGDNFIATVYENPGYSGQFLYSGTITINDDSTLTITSDESYTAPSTGYYFSCTKTFSFVLNTNVSDPTDSSKPLTVPVEITPNN